ncbi:MAG: hypothetical protein GC154_15055 [bacterium]|nr:hypothetical protein [bacterium]
MPLIGVIAYIVAAGAVFTFRLVDENRVEAYNDAIIAIVCLLASFVFYQVSKRFQKNDEARLSWRLFCIGIGLEGAGHVVYAVIELILNQEVPYPSIADLFITIGMLFNISALWSFSQKFNRLNLAPSTGRTILANFIIAVFAAGTYYFIIQPVLFDESEALWLRIAYQIYPVLDLILAYFCFNLALSFLEMGASPLAAPWQTLIAAYLLFLITDSAYGYYDAMGLYHSYMWINPGWGLSYILIAHAAYKQKKLMAGFEASIPVFSLDDESAE